MKPANLIIIIAVLIILAVISYFAFKERTQTPGIFEAKGEKLFPKLVTGTIEKIVISKSGKEAVLEKSGDTWIDESRWGYPADKSRIDAFLKQFDELKITDRRTTKKENHSDFEVTPEMGITVALFVTGDKEAARAVIGKSPDYMRVFARRASENDVYLVEPNLTYQLGADYNTKELNPNYWVDMKITDFDQTQIAKINLHSPDGDIALERAEKEKPAEPKPETEEVKKEEGKEAEKKEETKETPAKEEIWNVIAPEQFEAKKAVVDGIASAIARLRGISPVEKKDLAEYCLDNPTNTASAILKDGVEKKLFFGKKTEKNEYYVKTADSDLIYLVAEYNFNNIFKKVADLKETPPPETKPAEGEQPKTGEKAKEGEKPKIEEKPKEEVPKTGEMPK
jgi:hypothetical protein